MFAKLVKAATGRVSYDTITVCTECKHVQVFDRRFNERRPTKTGHEFHR